MLKFGYKGIPYVLWNPFYCETLVSVPTANQTMDCQKVLKNLKLKLDLHKSCAAKKASFADVDSIPSETYTYNHRDRVADKIIGITE